jgi:hypothetical protein
MQISYCIQWSRNYNRPSKMLGEAQARRAHENGKLYTVLLGDPLRPHCFLEFTRFRSVGVEFMDAALRTYYDYTLQEFEQLRPNELFISKSRRLEFRNDDGEFDRGTVFYFKPDGRLKIFRYQGNPDGVGSKIVGEEERTVDVSRNWEPYPKFGDYASLATRDRGSPWLTYTPPGER